MNAVGGVLNPVNQGIWTRIHNQSGGAMELIAALEAYTVTLARNAPQLFTQPFDAVHPNLSELLQLIINIEVEDNCQTFNKSMCLVNK